MVDERDDPNFDVPASSSFSGAAAGSLAVVARMVVSDPGAPVKETALVLSDAFLAQLRIKGPIPR